VATEYRNITGRSDLNIKQHHEIIDIRDRIGRKYQIKTLKTLILEQEIIFLTRILDKIENNKDELS
jgi:hypothetical protein